MSTLLFRAQRYGIISALAMIASTGIAQSSPVIKTQIVGPWSIAVSVENHGSDRLAKAEKTFTIKPAEVVTVTGEEVTDVPVYNKMADKWSRGERPDGIKACESTQPEALIPSSFTMSTKSGLSLLRGKDFDLENQWGVFGRLPGGKLHAHEPVTISYRYYLQRIDSIYQEKAGGLGFQEGISRIGTPLPPTLPDGARRLVNIWIENGNEGALQSTNIFQITEDQPPRDRELHLDKVREMLPKTIKKLEQGKPIAILAWGDSVTDGACLSNKSDGWQHVFVRRLQAQYPKARITLHTEAWPAHNTESYLEAPPGTPHNFQDSVLALHPDLVISEFVNDASLSAAETKARYSFLLTKFQAIQAEWIILTPAYTSLWMGEQNWRGYSDQHFLDEDPRPYVVVLRQFSGKRGVVIADAAMRWGRLWRQGIPYTTLLLNSINHPDARGHKIYADSLLALFTG